MSVRVDRQLLLAYAATVDHGKTGDRRGGIADYDGDGQPFVLTHDERAVRLARGPVNSNGFHERELEMTWTEIAATNDCPSVQK